MCGICAIVHPDHTFPVDAEVLRRMRDSLSHRGPDDAGLYVAPGIGLASRRLAILDLSRRGRMPMNTADGRFWIVYNGEVYNYQDLRHSLSAQGVAFESNTDTEVLLKLFVAEGPAMLDKLNGMFAFAIWDAVERRLFVARDRLGVKPVFYTFRDGILSISSEPKALFAAGAERRFDHTTWSELLCFRFLAGERTPFEGVRRLLPGHYLVWHDGLLSIRRWWNLAERARLARESPIRDSLEWYRRTFDDAVRLRMISDVPVGVLLSGGLDSSSISASLATQQLGQVKSFTVGFEDSQYDESGLASQVASQYRLATHHLQVLPEHLLSWLEEASWFNDEPIAHSNDPHLLAISRHAKPRVSVLLSGEGADETLGGYIRYRPLYHSKALTAARPLLRMVDRLGISRVAGVSWTDSSICRGASSCSITPATRFLTICSRSV